jgi:AraC family transcriptional regulator
MEKAPVYPPDQAILICVSLTPAAIGQWQAVYNGRSVGVMRAIPFATTFIDLNCRMKMSVRGPFDYLHYYFSRELLERIALDNDVAPSLQLRELFFVEDLVVAQVTRNILSFVKRGEPLDRLALDQTATVLGAHVLQAHCGTPKFNIPPRRGLEPWQKLRTSKTLVEIALSAGFYDQAAFSRTFSRIEHVTPSRWRRLNVDGTKSTPKRRLSSV